VGIWTYFYRDDIGPLIIILKGRIIIAKRYIKVLKKYFILFYRRIRRKYRA
jgi:hypothetical protein